MKKHFVLLIIILISCSLLITYSQHSNSNNSSVKVGEVIKDAPYNIEMIYIPEGTFIMGSNNADDEKPPHEVSLDDYFIGKYLVTQKEWVAVMGSNPSENVGDDLPVENVSWIDAQEFCRKLSDKTGKKYRLPTDAEWEYACRAGSTTVFHFGNDTLKLGEYAWYRGNSGDKTHPVGKKKPNAWGLYDMAGNVWEWCEDWWDPEYYSRSEYKNPINTKKYYWENPRTKEKSALRVARSGHFRNSPKGLESAHRHCTGPMEKSNSIGFRLVREKNP
ncbi:formylglycine-generating enzyme family protein [candidate division KSB1 bacterium]